MGLGLVVLPDLVKDVEGGFVLKDALTAVLGAEPQPGNHIKLVACQSALRGQAFGLAYPP